MAVTVSVSVTVIDHSLRSLPTSPAAARSKIRAGVEYTRDLRNGLGVAMRIGLVRGCCATIVVLDGMISDLDELREAEENGGGNGS